MRGAAGWTRLAGHGRCDLCRPQKRAPRFGLINQLASTKQPEKVRSLKNPRLFWQVSIPAERNIAGRAPRGGAVFCIFLAKTVTHRRGGQAEPPPKWGISESPLCPSLGGGTRRGSKINAVFSRMARRAVGRKKKHLFTRRPWSDVLKLPKK